MIRTSSDRLSALKFMSGWLVLTLLLNMRYPAPLPHPLAILLPPPELFAIAAAMTIAAWRRITIPRSVFGLVTLLLVLTWLFHLGESIVSAYLNRRLSLYTDAAFVPDLYHLLYTTVSKPVFVLALAGSVLIVAALFGLIFVSLQFMNRSLGCRPIRTWFFGVGAAFAAGYVAILPFLPIQSPLRLPSQSSFVRMVEELWVVANIDAYRKEFLAQLQDTSSAPSRFEGSLDRLQGNDVYLFYIESYGHSVFVNHRQRELMLPVLVQFENQLQSQGYAIHSNFLNSPAYGGASWLAHATVASGFHLDKQFRYNLVVTSEAKTAMHAFAAAGYRTVSVMPGVIWPWPEADFFGFDKKYYKLQFDYQGPPYGWSTMPDQYVLDTIYRLEIAQRKQPLFIEFVLISSHAPFHEQPPYLDDWSEIGNGAVYLQKDKITFPVSWPDLKNADEAYTTALAYEFKVLQAFIEQRITDDTLLLIMGDHQPNLKITGPNQPWSVPVHVISRNPDFLKPFAERGYTAGMIPNQPTPHLDMASVMSALFEDFSTPAQSGRNDPEPKVIP